MHSTLPEHIEDTIRLLIATAPPVSKWQEYGFESEEQMAAWVEQTVAKFEDRLRQLKEDSPPACDQSD